MAQNKFTFFRRQNPPLACRQIAKPKISYSHAHQPQSRMADGCRHAPHLTIFAFNQFQPNPAIRHAFAEADGWIARRNYWLRFQNPCAAGQGFPALNRNAAFQFLQTFRRGNVFNLCPILALVCVARMQQAFVPCRFIAQEQQTFGIGIEPANGINIFRKIKFRQRAVGRVVISELRKHAERFVERNKHDRFLTSKLRRTQRKK
jgi:hypothetical protein